MAAPEDNAEHTGGKLGGHGVGIAMVAIFAGMAFVVAIAASDGAIFGQNFQSTPSEEVPVSSGAEDAVTLSSDTFSEGSGADGSSATAPPPDDGATLSEEERRLLAMKDFPWESVAGGHVASNQDAFQRFGQQPVAQQRPVEPGTEPLSLSDQVAVDVDRRDRGDRDRDDSDGDTSQADIIEIDIPIGDDDEEEQPDVVEDDAPGDDQEGSGDGTDDGSSGEGSGEDNSGSGSDGDQSGEPGDEGDSGGSNSTDTSDPSEDSGSGSDGNDTGDGNSTDAEATVSVG